MFKEEKLFFETSDGLRLCGVLSIPKAPTNKCIILCHGITVDKDEGGIFSEISKRLAEEGFATFRFDFRGHGESGGEEIDMTIMGEAKDLEAAIKLMKDKGYRDFGILGASFAGGAISVFCFGNPGIVKALVLWNPIIDYSDLLNPTTEWNVKYWGKNAIENVDKFGYSEVGSKKFKIGRGLIHEIKTLKPWSMLQKARIPILFVHGTNDSYVSVQNSVRYASLIKDAKFTPIHGAEHGFHDNEKHKEEAYAATEDFFKQHL